jgi:hypothetical protein
MTGNNSTSEAGPDTRLTLTMDDEFMNEITLTGFEA